MHTSTSPPPVSTRHNPLNIIYDIYSMNIVHAFYLGESLPVLISLRIQHCCNNWRRSTDCHTPCTPVWSTFAAEQTSGEGHIYLDDTSVSPGCMISYPELRHYYLLCTLYDHVCLSQVPLWLTFRAGYLSWTTTNVDVLDNPLTIL